MQESGQGLQETLPLTDLMVLLEDFSADLVNASPNAVDQEQMMGLLQAFDSALANATDG